MFLCLQRIGIRRLAALWLASWLAAPAAWGVAVTQAPAVQGTTAETYSCTSLASGGTRAWSNAFRAWSDNNSNASVSVDGTTSRFLQCTGYAFAIPATATINGIVVTVARRSNRTTDGGARDAMVRVVKGGVVGTTDRSTATIYTTTEVKEDHGGPTDLWGETWTPADINSASFGAAFAATKPNAAGNAHSVVVDVLSITVHYTPDSLPPTVTSIVRASPNPAAGVTAAWTVTFSEAVTGVDSGDFALAASGLSGTSIASVTGSGTTWTVTANTGSGAGTLGLNLVDNDTILDLGANRLGGTGTGNGNRTGEVFTVDRVTLNALAVARTGSTPTNAASLAWLVTFNRAVTGVDAGDFQLATSGTAAGSITSVSGSGTSWTVTATGVSGTGTLGLNLVDNDSIVDSLAERLGGTGTGNGNETGEVYSVDRTVPTVISIQRASATPSTADILGWTVVFSKSVTGVNAGDFSLAASGLSGARVLTVTGSGTTWTVTADPGYASSSGSLGLNLVDDDTITDAIGNRLGGTGTGNGNATGEVYTVSTPPLASYLMEEATWTGAAGEAVDETGNNPGTAASGATTTALSPALTGLNGTCRYGVFTSSSTPVVTGGSLNLGTTFPYETDSFTLVGWVRTTANSTANQWIFSHNTGGKGYALVLGNAGPGRLRFTAAMAATPNLDSPSGSTSLLASNTWYYVAAVADFSAAPNITRTLYVYDTSGALLPGYPVSVTSTGWDDTEAGAATIGSNGSNSFVGHLDDIQLFGKALTVEAIATLAQARHTCGAMAPDHYEMSLATSSLTCQPSTVTVTACADASSPCTNAFTAISGSTATLGASAGTLGSTTLTFDSSGRASTTLFHPTAAQASTATVTLSGESAPGNNARQCCPNGVSCTAANSCSTTFSTTGFVFNVANHVSETLQTVSVSAVRQSDSATVCVPAFASTSRNVTFSCGYTNPTTGSLPVRVGGAALNASASAAAACDAGGRAVSLAFNASGVASTTVQYADVGNMLLSARYTGSAGSGDAGLVMTGSDSFIAAPSGLTVSGVTSGPIKAGSSFAATVSAVNSAGATTPNHGRETSPEGVTLSWVRIQPSGSGAAKGSFSGSLGAFSGGSATASNLAWTEVGRGDLVARSASTGGYLGSTLRAFGASPASGAVQCALENANCVVPGGITATVYYGENGGYAAKTGQTGTVACTNANFTDPLSGTQKKCWYVATSATTGSVGDFIPHRFTVAASNACGTFSYAGQTIATTVTAQNAAGNTTVNFNGTATTSPSFAQAVTLADANSLGLGSLSGASIAATAFSAGVASGTPSYSFTNKATAPQSLVLRATNGASGTALISSQGYAEPTLPLRSGRLRLSNAFGQASAALQVPVVAEYWGGSAWQLNSADNCSALAGNSVALSNPRGPTGATSTATSGAGAVAIVNGSGTLTLAAPSPAGSSLSLDLAVNLGSAGTDQSCNTTKPATTGAARPWLRALNGSCAATADRDPAARASFGIFAPETRKTVHVRDIY